MLTIQDPSTKYRISLWHLGFRPFFLGASIFAFISMFIWFGIQSLGWQLQTENINSIAWHSHEMIYGYALAVIAGFLLTAVRNWTGVNTLHGWKLAVLFLLWVAARCLALIPFNHHLLFVAVLELLFISGLLFALLRPVLKVRQWRQLGILLIVFSFLLGDILYFMSILGWWQASYQVGVYIGFYLVLMLIFIMARRVVPFFIEKGVSASITIQNWAWLDYLSLILFAVYVLLELLMAHQFSKLLALLLFVLHGLRLWQWHHREIWTRPLLWVLYLAYSMLVLGFAMQGLSLFISISSGLVTHAFAVGGVGVMTIGMMARVALGHTGRDVFHPPKLLSLIFIIFLFAGITRVLLPIVFGQYYTLWIAISQIAWMVSFVLFVWLYLPMLIRPRVDGQYG